MIKRREIFAWSVYDCANSAFALSIMAAFFPGFFKNFWAAGMNPNKSTAILGFVGAVTGIAVAVLSPVVGTFSGIRGIRKRMMVFLVTFAVMLNTFFFFLGKGAWISAVVVFMVVRVAFNLSNMLYDSFLVNISSPSERDFVSSLGFSVGYIGSSILFIVNLVMFLKPDIFGISNKNLAVRLIFISVSFWWFLFSIPFFLVVSENRKKEDTVISGNLANDFFKSFTNIGKMFSKIKGNRSVLLFLVAYWLYFDGIFTVVTMATDFGLSLGLGMQTLMTALLVVQLVAFPFSLFWGILAGKVGVKLILVILLFVYLLITSVGIWFLSTPFHYMIFAVLVGLSQGGIQALSRSAFSKMIPEGKESDYFGLFNMVGRFALIVGPLIMAVVNYILSFTSLSAEMVTRFGAFSLSLLFIAGISILLKVDLSEKI